MADHLVLRTMRFASWMLLVLGGGVTICFRFVFQSSSLNGYSAIVLLDACPAQDLWLLPHGLYGVASSKSVG